MHNDQDEHAVIECLIHWAESQPLVCAMILTSTRAILNGQTDIFSDYDIILILTDILPYYQDRSWLDYFGIVLAIYRDPLESKDGFTKSGYVVQYQDGLKIDFGLWPVIFLQRIVKEPDLPLEFDAGYRVIYDPDHLCAALKPPSYKAYIPTEPTEDLYLETIEGFFLDTAYVAKYLWRDDLVAAKHLLDYYMKQEQLIPMLVWHFEIEHNWTIKPGPYGRGLKKWLCPDLWAKLEDTYTGCSTETNWQALFKSITLFRIAAIEVGNSLGFPYPEQLEQRVLDYLHQVKLLERL